MSSPPPRDDFIKTFCQDIGDIEPLTAFFSESESSSGAQEDDFDAATRSNETYQAWLNQTRHGTDPWKKRRKEANQKNKRKSTYDVRREQKVELTLEVEKLQKKLDELKFRVLVEQGEATRSNEQVAATNSVLQEFIQDQHVQLASAQAVLACNMQQNINSLAPVHTILNLGTDRTERHCKLMALKNKKLQEAKRFIASRSRGLDPRTAHSHEERNDTPGEDYSLTHFENVPIHGASARDIFDAFINVVQNAEIVISDVFGSLTIRENCEADTHNVSQMRMVTSTSMGTLVESNTTMFTQFEESHDDKDGSYGIIVADFVDFDELHPYKPEERVRRDTTTLFMVRSFNRSKDRKCQTTTDEKKPKPTVVATRWTCSTIRRSKMELSVDALREIQESTVSYGDTMKKCIQQRLGKANIYKADKDAITTASN